MGLILYNLFQVLYAAFAEVYSLFNDKAGKWVAGRKNWEQTVTGALNPGEKRIWIHCSSVGEFEQARPVIAALQREQPGYKIVLTFFSPSGYEANSKTAFADYVFYLPVDNKQNAARFIELIGPSLVVFIKYEFWYYYLQQLKQRAIPVVLVSGVFREGQVFFKWYGRFFRDMLNSFTFFFLQDDASKALLQGIGIGNNSMISGDTRYDRVSAIAQQVEPIDQVVMFKDDHKIFIAGSTWPSDEAVISECITLLPDDWKMIIAPHEIDADHIRKVQQLFGSDAVLFSELDAARTGYDKKMLVIDNIGMLSRLFAYGDVAFIGGGFDKDGIHNILEPAVFGLPIIFGPVYQKYVEANMLVSLQLVFPVSNAAECKEKLTKLIADAAYRSTVKASLKQFMREHTGATDIIMKQIGKEKWLG